MADETGSSSSPSASSDDVNAWEYILIWVGFLFVSVAASQLAVVFPRIRLPLITGYLFVGVISGPDVLGFLTREDLPLLSPVNQFVLAFIGFSAGAELYLPELRDLFKNIFLSVGAISVFTFVLITGVIRALMNTSVVTFVSGLSPGCKTGIAMLIGAIMTARSPASAIAIVKELKAKGPFTRAFLGITVVSDVVVLVLFAISVSFTRGQCTGAGFSGESVLTLLASLTLAVVLGYFALGKLIVLLLFIKPNIKLPPKWLILPIGYGIFRLSEKIADVTLDHMGHEINLEPLLMTIVSGYVATNQSRNRRLFLSMLQKVGPYVFIPFFTLTGASLNLGVLYKSALLAVITMILRMLAIGAGSIVGGVLARAPRKHTEYMWLSLITQAGVSLGLAGEINFMFPDWGPACATAIVAVIMLNQIAGPILCKISIKKVGEHGKAKGADDEEGGKSALIIGINGYSLALAERLKNSHWKVIMTDSVESKLAYALKLNTTHTPQAHDQSSDAHAIQKKKKVYQNLEEELEVEGPAGSINDPAAATATSTASTTTPSHMEKGAADAHIDEHEIIYDIQAKLMKDLDKSEAPESEAMFTQWNFRELSVGLEIKSDVIVCMLETDNANVSACSYFKQQLKFSRVIGSISAPTAADAYLRAGAIPFYTLSASINMLFQCVTAHRPNYSALASVITPEAEGFPNNIELLPHLHPLPDNPDALEDAESIDLNSPNSQNAQSPPTSNLLDLDIEAPSPHAPISPTSSNPHIARLQQVGGIMRDSFNTTQARLRELRDPVGLVQRGVAQMQVVPDAQRDEYLDSIQGLGDAMTRPVTTNSIWMDLLSTPEQSSQRVDPMFADPSQMQSTFRTDMSVFEEYQDMEMSHQHKGQ